MEVKPATGRADVRILPATWKLKRLGDVVTTLRSGSYGNEDTSDGLTAMPVATTAHISEYDSWNGKEMQQRFFTPIQIASCSVKKGDLVVVKSSGSAASIKSGKIGFVEDWQAGAFLFSNFLMTLRPIGVQPRYLYYHLTSYDVKQLLPSLVEASTYPNLRIDEYLAIEVPIPEEREQSAIAEALGDVDALIAALEKLLTLKRHIKDGVAQELLTGKKRLPGFSGDWEVKLLGDLATFHKGNGLPKSALEPFGAELCIHYGELFTRYAETIRAIISRTNGSGNCVRSVANDVLMPTSDVTPNGLAKASCVRTGGVILGGDILVVRVNGGLVSGSFLSYVIRQAKEQVLQLVTGTTVFHLYAADMKKFTFFMPSLVEQRAIVAVLDDMAAEIAALEARLAKTRQLKQGMMQELLTGRIRLV